MQKIVLIPFYLILGKKLRLTQRIWTFFHDAENFFDIFFGYYGISSIIIYKNVLEIAVGNVK